MDIPNSNPWLWQRQLAQDIDALQDANATEDELIEYERQFLAAVPTPMSGGIARELREGL